MGKKARILLFCHKGMTPAALPTPYSSLQAVDINNMTFEEKLTTVAEVISTSLGVRRSVTTTVSDAGASPPSESFASTQRGWSLRPAAHVGETAVGQFLVGAVSPSRPDRANAAGLQPGESLFVRLFLGNTAEGRFINAMVGGKTAAFFERVIRDTVLIRATIRLAALFEEAEAAIPLLVIDDYEDISRS